jgi:hypothetical protein
MIAAALGAFAVLSGVVMPVCNTPIRADMSVGRRGYQETEVSCPSNTEDVVIGYAPPNVKSEFPFNYISEFPASAFSFENRGMKFRLSREHCSCAYLGRGFLPELRN